MHTAPEPPSTDANARWVEHNKGTWVAAGDRLQVAVPDCAAGRFLSVEFEVGDGRSCDFDIMFEPADESEGAFRLYGPTRRATKLSTAVPVTQAGTAYVTWDNIASWVQQKLVSYTVCVTEQEPKDVIQTSTLAFGRNVVRQMRKLTPGGGSELPPPEPQEVAVAAGTMGMVSKDVTEGHSLELVFEVSKGSDVDFMMALLPLGADGKADEQAEGTRLYGPTRRSSGLRVKMVMPHSGSVRVQFDATSSWFTSKLVSYTLDCRADESI